MKTCVKIEVTAFIHSKEANAEKSASGVVEIGAESGEKDWGKIVGALVSQAIACGPDDFPFPAKLMTPKQVEKYLDKQRAENDI